MGTAVIEEFLTGDSKEIQDLANNEAALVGFLTLAKGFDDLPDMSVRFYEESRGLYKVTSTGRSIDELVTIMSEFFGQPAKAPGKGLPVTLRFDPTVKYLGGIRKDQALFLNKLKTGSFYGALWPWQRNADKIEVLLGYFSSSMSDSDFKQLETLVKKFLSKKAIENISGVGGQIHGISLPSFLQMSEMEGATYALKVTSGNRFGYLYLDGGNLIAAQLEERTGNEAAYRIISWENAAIQIESSDPARAREINDPLMHVMMESLKIKDEADAGLPPASPDLQVQATPPKSEKSPPVDRQTTEKDTQPPKKPVKKAPKPVQKKRANKAAVPPPQPDPLVSVPFQKPTDHSVGIQDQMSRTTKLLIVLGVVIVFAIVVTGGGYLTKKRQANRRYDRLIADLSVTKELDAQIVLMMQYIKAHPEDTHRSELEARLNDAYIEIEKQDYEKTILDVNRLPIDEKFEKKALSLYTAFLAKYPQSVYAKQINEAIEGIRQLLGTAYFEDLKTVSATNFFDRYTAYRDYIEQFPQGSEREAVERMISDLAKEYYAIIEKRAVICDAEEEWDECIAQCDQFLSTFIDDDLVEKVEMLRAVLQDKKDVVELSEQAALVSEDFAKAKKVYTDYLIRRPETTQKETILQRIAALDTELEKQREWKITAEYATNPANDIFSRIQRLDMFAENHGIGPYSKLAGNLRSQLDPEFQEALRAQRKESQRRQELARQRAEQADRIREAQRIQMLRKQVAKQLLPVANRFFDHKNGAVTDQVTGLTWCLLDSRLDLGRCIDYSTAKSYVQGLNIGGRSDWHLPTAGELATLYKNKPFFPGSGAAWYWTSESFARGYHRVVDVVTSEQETVFNRISKNEDSCGAVRAVLR